ncbi:hypothetical protein BD410DRAFT_136826 [Rickenella mellea]|uniref:Secreted protein n=1 Tax=Rickenella mellea TaxID=50990 RepID=A0A4Y7PIS8_9AGAM|nr:hypothetical protein BD410DRAFT_136826 [Rickenella mellea]
MYFYILLLLWTAGFFALPPRQLLDPALYEPVPSPVLCDGVYSQALKLQRLNRRGVLHMHRSRYTGERYFPSAQIRHDILSSGHLSTSIFTHNGLAASIFFDINRLCCDASHHCSSHFR